MAEGQPQAEEAAEREIQVFVNNHFYLLDTEGDGMSKGVGLQGGDPEEALVDDLEEGDVDKGGDGEGKEEVVEKLSSRRWQVRQWRLRDEHCQEEGESADQAEEDGNEGGGDDVGGDENEKLPEVGEGDQTQPFVKPHLPISL